jgi:predicted  nucleic acid-binding Zn-ribbon protein
MPIAGTGVEITGDVIIFFGIGFLLAALLGVAFFPLVHRRAVRLTSRRLETQSPMSMQEIKAEKDHLRAEFAMSTRRLETSIEELKAKTFVHVNALAQKSNVITRLKAELDARAARIHALEQHERALEGREKSLFEQLRASKEEMAKVTEELRDAELTVTDMRKIQHRLEDATDALRNAERSVADMRESQQQLEGAFEERSWLADSQRNEIVALKTEVAIIRQQIYEMAAAIVEAESRPTHEWTQTRDAAAAGGRSGEVLANDRLNDNAPEADVFHAAFNRNPFTGVDERAPLPESQRHEIIALKTEVEAIRQQVYETASAILETESLSVRDWLELHEAAAARSRNSEDFTDDRPNNDAEDDGLYHLLNSSPFTDTGSHRNSGTYDDRGSGFALTDAAAEPHARRPRRG